MAPPELLRLWEVVRWDLERARQLLPASSNEVEGSLAQLDDWLAHNELELALTELIALGEGNNRPAAFWERLRGAADRMGLSGSVERIDAILARSREADG